MFKKRRNIKSKNEKTRNSAFKRLKNDASKKMKMQDRPEFTKSTFAVWCLKNKAKEITANQKQENVIFFINKDFYY